MRDDFVRKGITPIMSYGGATVFHKEGDYTAFLDLLATAKATHPVNLLGFCLMPNHFHLVVQPVTAAVPTLCAAHSPLAT